MSLALLKLGLIVIGLAIFLRRAAGRMAPKMVFAPLMFLITRVPVLVVATSGTLGMASLILPGAIAAGDDGFGTILQLGLICLLCGFGLASLTVGPVWAILRATADRPAFPLEPGEEILWETKANHFLDGEARGGVAILTNRRLGFRPHKFNVQLAAWSTPLDRIAGAGREGMRLVSLELEGATDLAFFVVMDPDDFIDRVTAPCGGIIG